MRTAQPENDSETVETSTSPPHEDVPQEATPNPSDKLLLVETVHSQVDLL